MNEDDIVIVKEISEINFISTLKVRIANIISVNNLIYVEIFNLVISDIVCEDLNDIEIDIIN